MSKLLRRGGRAPWRSAAVAALASVMVAAVITWIAGVGGTAQAAIVFTDDFEDGNSSGWTMSGTGTWSVASDGTQVLRTSGAAAADSKAFAGSAWTDYALQARVKPVSFDGTNRFVGIAARVQDDLNYYYLALRSNNTAELKKLVAGAPTTLGSISLAVAAGSWYTVRLQVAGSTVTGSVNGTQIASVTDTQFSGGRIGAITYSASASYDDVTVDTVAAPTSSPTTSPTSPPPGNGKQMEDLNRGVISVRSGSGNLVSWRLFGYESSATGFNVYRGSTKVNATPITNSTNYMDSGAAADASYTVRAVVDGVEQGASEPSLRFAGGSYLDVPISRPGSDYTAGDASVGDADGDGQYEIFLKWDPSDQKDNSQSGVTSNVYIDAYRLNGQRLWRIDLGRNIRAGAHYTQFQVYDYDGDGDAELAVKTGDGTVSGTGQVIGNGSALHRNSDGYIITGPEYLTMFNGLTGAVLSTVNFEPARGNINDWGDNYGNRGDRFLAGTAYLDGQRPSLIMGRGYYAKSAIAAYDFRNGALALRWKFDSSSAGSSWTGRGAHSLSIADVDGNGTDEVIYGGMTINANGTGRYTTSFYAHGDALHVSDFVPSRAGKEIWMIHEQSSGAAATLRDANNGSVIMQKTNTCGCEGPARGVAADVYAGNAGGEFWGVGTGLTNLFNASGGSVGRTPGSSNFLAWWDADTTRELLDGNHVDKYGTGGDTRLLTASGAHSINGTKATPSLSGDILGDWREEIILPRDDNAALRIYSTPNPTTTKIYTLAHDAQYRVALAWQNTAYNQPPHPSFHIGSGMAAPPQPNIYVR